MNISSMELKRLLGRLSLFLQHHFEGETLGKRFWNFLTSNFRQSEDKKIIKNFHEDPDKNFKVLARLIQARADVDIAFRGSLQKFIESTKYKPAKKGRVYRSFPKWPERGVAHEMSEGYAKKRAVKKEVKKVVRKAIKKAAKKTIYKAIRKKVAVKKKGAAKKAAKKSAPSKKVFHKISPKPQKEICYSKVEMDKTVQMKQIANVEVTVSRERLSKRNNRSGETSEFSVDPQNPLKIVIRNVLNFKTIGKHEFNIATPEPDNPVSTTFKVKPVKVGECKLAVDIWQGQALFCSMKVTSNAVDRKTVQRKTRVKATSIPSPNYPGSFSQLIITEDQVGNSCYYNYWLQVPELKINHKFRSPEINGKREDYITGLYEEIENLWGTAANNQEQFRNELNNFGSELFESLFPLELKQLLYDNRNKIKAIQVMSEEPFIPWELALIKRPGKIFRWKSTDKYLGQMGLTRWLWNSHATQKLSIRKGRAHYVIPEYFTDELKLPAAAIEKSYLEKTFKAKPVIPDPLKVDRFIRKAGNYDLLHFCCHGTADSRNAINSKLMLLEKRKNGEFVPTYLTQKSIQECGLISRGDNRPIIILNACQAGRSGKGIVRYNGFASAFLQAGAGIFVGSLWSVEDKPATTFMTALYDSLRRGLTLAEATINARDSAKDEKDATWISYVVYGNPFATVSQT